jgi:PAS domain S-box-containing protein
VVRSRSPADRSPGETPSASQGSVEMRERIRSHDWPATPLGPVDAWPPRLYMAVELMLDMNQPACISWGTDARLIYNDGYISILGDRHPDALGRTLAEVWPELVDPVEHGVDSVQDCGAQLLVNHEFPLQTGGGARNRRCATTWTPLRDETGEVAGTLNILTETTYQGPAERAMGANEAQYRTLFTAMDQGFCVIERVERSADQPVDFRYITANPAFERHTGMHDVIGRTIRELVPGAEEEVFDLYDEVVRTGQHRQFEAHVAALDLWMEAEAFPTQRPGQIAVLFNNVSARKRAEQALRESEVRLRRAMEIDTVGVIFFKTTGEIIFANDAFLRMSGYSLEDWERGLVRWDEMTPPEFIPRSEEAAAEFERHGRTTPYEKQYIRKDGSRWWALFAATRIGPDEGVEFVLDITARRHAEDVRRQTAEELEVRVAERTAQLAAAVEETRAREERVQLLLDQMPAMLWTTDRTLCVTALVGASFSARNAAQLPFEGRSVAELFADTDMDSTAGVIHESVLTGIPVEFEFRVESHTYEAHVEPLRDADGHIAGTISVAHDVTDRTLRRLQEDFIASVSHELQTPLTSMRAGLGLLDSAIGQTLDPPERELLAAARRNAERLRLEIGQLLAANQVLVGERPVVERAAIDLRALVEGAVEAVRPLLQEKEQTVDVDMPDRLHVHGDRRLMDQVLANLLSNAYRHTPPRTRISVSSWFVGDQVRLAVHDTGPGIAESELEAIFQRFYRAPGKKREGIGLGLAMARSAVEAQGGRLWVESVSGQGTTFFVSLPGARAERDV